jgi:hypothetical protein
MKKVKERSVQPREVKGKSPRDIGLDLGYGNKMVGGAVEPGRVVITTKEPGGEIVQHEHPIAGTEV